MQVFPNERGFEVGLPRDSAVKALGDFYRFPESFFILVSYISNGMIFYHEQEERWDITERMNIQGNFEYNHGREWFETWMRRQFSRLGN